MESGHLEGLKEQTALGGTHLLLEDHSSCTKEVVPGDEVTGVRILQRPLSTSTAHAAKPSQIIQSNSHPPLLQICPIYGAGPPNSIQSRIQWNLGTESHKGL
ncbi:leukemia-associated protein 7 [Platysternon megacephalum]|uniref:Leukemia-associated protein 7 n=1 Tax=Platysternon megacephalum TaxID=55544 RepID=A0A4D9EMI7_9SAUR|nr:leukemia-associated protein 7 [Platysternon megacephalum]